MKRISRITALLATGALLFSGFMMSCSHSSSDDGEPENVPSAEPSGTPDEDKPTVEIDGDITRVTPDSTATAGTITAPRETESTGVNPDSDIVIASSSKPATVKIYEGETLVDTINASSEKLYSGGDSGAVTELNVKDQLILTVDGNVIVKPHFDSNGYGKLDYNKTYTVKFDDETKLTFTTRAAAPSISGNSISVGSSADSNFATIQGALNYLRKNSCTGDWTINVAEGSYHERLFYKGDANVTLLGPADSGSTAYGDKAVIYWKNNNQWNGTSRTRVNFLWQGGNLTLKNLTLKSTYLRKDSVDVKTTYGDDGKDARNEVLNFDVKKYLVANDCSFVGTQDTLILGNNGGRAWFYKNFIEGDVDFIWGTLDVALFEECVINISDADTNAGYIFASRTVETNEVNKGFVLFNSTIKVPSSSDFKSYYGRNSGADTQAAVVNCTLTNMVEKTLWSSAATKNKFELNGDAGVAYKDFGNVLSDGTAVDVSNRLGQTYTMSKRVALREYNGRHAILNRGFDVDSLSYKTSSTIWDISSYETEFNATADDSANNVFVEPVYAKNVIGGQTVQLSADSFKSGITYTYESSDTSIATVNSDGLVTAIEGVEGVATITMTGSNGKKDYFQIKVIKSEIKATSVSVSLEASSVAKYGLTTATVSFTPSDTTVKSVTFTSSDPKVKFYDASTKTLVSELTTESSTARIWVGGDVSDVTVTAKSTEYANAAAGTATISSKSGEATWCAEAGSYRVATDIQSGNYGIWDGLVIDSNAANSSLISANGKMSLKTAEKMQTRNVILYIPVEGASTVAINLASGSDGCSYYVGESTSNAFTANSDKTVWSYTYDGGSTGIVLGSAISGLGTATKAVGEVKKNGKYLRVDVVKGSGDVYVTSIDVKKTGDFSATFGETEQTGASGVYTLSDSSVAKNTALADGTSSDGFVSWTGLTSNGNDYAYTSASSTVSITVSGASIITLTGCYNGTNGKTLTVTYSSNNTILSGAYTSSDQTLSFLYTGDATTLTLSWNGYAYITAVQVADGSDATESVSSVSVSGASEIAVGATSAYTATVSAAYITTDKSVTWTSSDESVATVADDGTVTAVSAGTAKITATSVFDTSKSGSVDVTVSSTVSDTFEETTTISFGSSGNYKTLTKLDTSNASIRDNGGNNSQISSGYISFKVKSGAVIDVSSYSGYTSYTLSDGTTTSAEQTGTSYSFTATSDCTITLTAVNANNYLYSITITYSE